MPVSSRHETVPSLVRDRPELLAMLHVEVPRFTRARTSDIALHEAAPVEHFADALVLLSFEDRPVLGVIVEAQLRRDDRKLYTWPQYAMNARARYKCPFLVLVATPSPSVARWAGQPIDVGNGAMFRAHIIGPETIPQVTDAKRAAREPELAVMSALTHGRRNTPTARAVAIAVITGLGEHPDDDGRVLYTMAVRNALGAALRKELEAMSDVIRNFLNAAERRTYDKVKAGAKAEAVLKILTKRGLTTTPLHRRQIEECTDLKTLDRWFDQALTAVSADELFGKPKRNGHRAPRRNGLRTARRS
jgi:hypothetical protein